jgi:hypothetical protein
MCTPSVLLTVCRCYEWADRSEEEESKDGQRSTPYTVARDDGGEPTSSTPPRTGDPEISLSHDYIATRFVCSVYPRPGAVRSVLLVGRAHVYSSGSIYRRLCVTAEDLDPLLVGRAHVYSSGSIYRRLCVPIVSGPRPVLSSRAHEETEQFLQFGSNVPAPNKFLQLCGRADSN